MAGRSRRVGRAVQAELEAFTAKRLLTADVQDDGGVVLGVTHEAFLKLGHRLPPRSMRLRPRFGLQL